MDSYQFKIKEKGEFCKNNNIDILIDDSPKQCNNALNNNVKTFIFDNPYNKTFTDNSAKRVYSWGQILSEIGNS